VKGTRVIRAVVTRRGHVIKRAKGRDLRKLSFTRISRKPFTVRVKLTTSSKGETVTLTRRVSAC
jgi:hypothetical protein